MTRKMGYEGVRGTRPYTTRHMRVDLVDRVRVLAAVLNVSMEHVVNMTMERGLASVERDVREGQR